MACKLMAWPIEAWPRRNECVVRCMQADGVVKDVAEAMIAVKCKWRRGNSVAEAKEDMRQAEQQESYRGFSGAVINTLPPNNGKRSGATGCEMNVRGDQRSPATRTGIEKELSGVTMALTPNPGAVPRARRAGTRLARRSEVGLWPSLVAGRRCWPGVRFPQWLVWSKSLAVQIAE